MPQWLRMLLLHPLCADAADGGGSGGSGSATGAGNSGEPELKYTQDQYQAGIDAAIGKERGRAERKTKKLAEDAVASWLKARGVTEEELDSALDRREVEAGKATELEVALKTAQRKIATLETSLEEVTSSRDKYHGLHRKRLVDDAVLEAAQKHKARVPQHVAKLVSDRVRLTEDDQVEVLDESGQPVHGTTVDQMVQKYLAEFPHLVSASDAAGGGSGGRPTGNQNGSGKSEIDWSTRDGKVAGLRQIAEEAGEL